MILDQKAKQFSTLVNLPVNLVQPSVAVGAFTLFDTVTLEPVIWAANGALVFGGSITFSGSTITAAVITTGLTASGSAANDFSGSTGTFLTSSGLTTISGGLKAATDTRSGAGAVSVTTLTTKLTTTGAAQALTLADGADGQIKTIIHDVDGGSAVLTPTTKTGFTTITFTAVGETATLQFCTTRGWFILAINGAVAA